MYHAISVDLDRPPPAATRCARSWSGPRWCITRASTGCWANWSPRPTTRPGGRRLRPRRQGQDGELHGQPGPGGRRPAGVPARGGGKAPRWTGAAPAPTASARSTSMLTPGARSQRDRRAGPRVRDGAGTGAQGPARVRGSRDRSQADRLASSGRTRASSAITTGGPATSSMRGPSFYKEHGPHLRRPSGDRRPAKLFIIAGPG